MKQRCDYKSVFKIGRHGRVSMVVSALLTSVTICFSAPMTNELPTNATVKNGNVNVSKNGNTLNINQSTNKSIINWNTYNIGKDATVNYNFENKNSSSLNRVTSNNPSQIYGNLNANGNVVLINPNGVVFGKGASVNVGSIVATTMNIQDSDYLNDKMVFLRENAIGEIINEATITAQDRGYVALLAPKVVNDGVIRAYQGTVSLAGGEKIELSLDNSGLKTVIVEPSKIQTLIENKSLVEADGGLIYIGVKEANELLDTAMNIKNTGTLQANSMEDLLGKVTLDGNNIEVSGAISAKDGSIYVGNKDVAKTVVKSTASLEADFVETSAKSLKVEDGVSIKGKQWLLDPVDFTIAAIGGDISASTLQGQLVGGNVELQADNAIYINQALSWSANKLTLTANEIDVNDILTMSGSSSINFNSSTVKMGMNVDPNDDTKVFTDGFKGRLDFTGTGEIYFQGIRASKIATVADFVGSYDVATAPDKWNQTGINVLVADIDLTGQSNKYAKMGAVDGLGHKISNWTISSTGSSPRALFDLSYTPSVSRPGFIRNLGVVDATMTNVGYGSAIITSEAKNNNALHNIYVTGSMSGNSDATYSLQGSGVISGNVVILSNGSTMPVFSDLYTNVTTTGTKSNNYHGGIFGIVTQNASGGSYTLKDSYAIGDFNFSNGSGVTGGLIARTLGVALSMDNVHYTGDMIVSTGYYFRQSGGLVGEISGSVCSGITNSYATSTITGDGRIGGLVGYSTGSLYIANSHYSGTLKMHDGQYFGGLIGLDLGVNTAGYGATITNSYSTGSIINANTYASDIDYIGGLIGSGGLYISDSYSTMTIDSKNNSTSRDMSSIGGLVGQNTLGSSSTLQIVRSYYDGTMGTSNSAGQTLYQVGGLVGKTENISITDSYAKGTFNNVKISSSYISSGGLVGQANGATFTINNSYASFDVSYISGSTPFAGLIGEITTSTASAISGTHGSGNFYRITGSNSVADASVAGGKYNNAWGATTIESMGSVKTLSQLQDDTTYSGWTTNGTKGWSLSGSDTPTLTFQSADRCRTCSNPTGALAVTATLPTVTTGIGTFTSINQILPTTMSSSLTLGTDYKIVLKDGGTTVFDSDDYASPELALAALNALPIKAYTSSITSKVSDISITATDKTVTVTAQASTATPPSANKKIGTFTDLTDILPTFSAGTPVLGTDYEFTLTDPANPSTPVFNSTGKTQQQILDALNALPVKDYTMAVQSKGTNYNMTATATSTVKLYDAPLVTAVLPSPTVTFGTFTSVNQVLPTSITGGNAVLGTDYKIILKDGTTTVFDSDVDDLAKLNSLQAKDYALSIAQKGSNYGVVATNTTVKIEPLAITATLPTKNVRVGSFENVADLLPTSFTAGTPSLGTDYKVILKDANNNVVYDSSTKTASQITADLNTLNALNVGNYSLSIASISGSNLNLSGTPTTIKVFDGAPSFGSLSATKGTTPGSSVLTTPLVAQAGTTIKYELVDAPIDTYPQAGDIAPTTGLTTYTDGMNLPAITAGKYLRIYEVDNTTGGVVKFQEKTLVANEIKTPDFPTDVLSKGTVGDSTKVSGITPNSGNTLKWVLADSSLPTPDIGTTPENGLTTYTDGSNIPAVTVGKYLRLYEVDPDGKVVKFEEKTLVANEIKTPDFPTDVLSKGTVGDSTKVSGITPNSGNTLKWVLADSSLPTPDIGTTPENGLTTYTDGSNIPAVTVGKYLRLYEVDPDGKVVKFEEKTLTASDIQSKEVLAVSDKAVKSIDNQLKQENNILPKAPIQDVASVSKAVVNDTVASGGNMKVQGEKAQLTASISAEANPFSGNDNIAVINGGLKAETQPAQAPIDNKPLPILAKQKGVDLTLAPVQAGAKEVTLVAKANIKDTNNFSFTVKEAVAVTLNMTNVVDAKASLGNGASLPSWLKFDKATQTFIANNPPSDALPITTVVTITDASGKSANMNVEITK